MTTETIEQASELVDRAEISSGTVLVEYSRTEAALADLRSKYSGAKFDLTTTAGDKAARAARLELVTLRTSLEKKRKELKAPAVEFGRKIDDEAKRITGEIVALEDPIDQQIKADEKRREAERQERERIEAERVSAIKTKIETIRSCAVRANAPDMTSERIQRGIDQVEAIDIDKQVFAEFTEEAAQAKSSTLAVMLNLRDLAKAREQEAARVEAQRIENERIAAEQRAAAEALAAQQKALAEQAAALAAQQKALDDAKAEEVARLEREAKARADEEARLERESAERQARIVAGASAAADLLDAALKFSQLNIPEQDPQQVLKAEPVMADATDRGEPAIASPSVGSMGSGQAADAAPNGGIRQIHPAAAALRNEQPTLKLGTICERLSFTVSAAFLAELGFTPAMDKRACLYRESQFGDICAALVQHIECVRAEVAIAA